MNAFAGLWVLFRGKDIMSDLVTPVRPEIDEDVNEPLDRRLDEPADRVSGARDGVYRNVG